MLKRSSIPGVAVAIFDHFLAKSFWREERRTFPLIVLNEQDRKEQKRLLGYFRGLTRSSVFFVFFEIL